MIFIYNLNFSIKMINFRLPLNLNTLPQQ